MEKETLDCIVGITILVLVISGIGIGFYALSILSSLKREKKQPLPSNVSVMPGKFEYIPLKDDYKDLYYSLIRSVGVTYLSSASAFRYSVEGNYRDAIIAMFIKGDRCAQQLKDLPKVNEVELRKHCVEACAGCIDRLSHADILYNYILTGKQPNNKEK